MNQQIFFVGSHDEVAHHAAPLQADREIRLVSPDEVLESAQPGDLAIFFTEHFDRFRHAITELKQRRVATCYMLDGILEWRNAWENAPDEPACPFTMRPVLSHKIACIGSSQARIIESWGNAGKTEVVGVPRFDGIRESGKNSQRQSGQTQRLMVITAKCPSYTESDQESLKRALLDLESLVQSRDKLEITWRLTAGWDEFLGVENAATEFSGVELSRQLREVDAVIATPSTALLEAMLLDIPTATIDYTSSPTYVRTAWQFASTEQLDSQIDSLLNPVPARMHFQQMLLNDELYASGNASDRMLMLIDRMLECAGKCIKKDQELTFPPAMLESDGKPTCNFVFDHATMFDRFEEFQLEDKTELQAQLAHARREIEHLTRQLAQLRSELGEAHRIFDQIESHPVAGPIVRARQKLIDMVHRMKKSAPQPDSG